MAERDRIELSPLPEFDLTPGQREALIITRDWTKEFFERMERDGKMDAGGHQFDHNQRVAGMAATLAVYEGHSPFLPALTGTIFDIGRTKADDVRSKNYLHGQLSREMSADFLNSLSIANEERVLIGDAMEVHPRLNEFLIEKEIMIKNSFGRIQAL